MTNFDISDITFLIAEDNAHMCSIIKMLLTSYGVRTIYEASDGADAIEVFKTNSPDIILTDLNMPIFNGIEFIQAVRHEKESPNPFVPIIMISGVALKQTIIDARNAGVNEFICKPLSAKALYNRIVNCLVNPRDFVKSANYFGPDRRRVNDPKAKHKKRRKKDKLETEEKNKNISIAS